MVQSLPIAPYNDALQGFRSACRVRMERIMGPELRERDIIAKVRSKRPELILAIGMDALQKLKSVKDIPILYVMVLSPHSIFQDHDNITGVSINIAPLKQLSLIKEGFPKLKRIGIFFDPAKSGRFLARAYNAASLLGIELVTRRVADSREAVAEVAKLHGLVDAFWLIPDTSVVTPATIDMLLLSAIENGIPVLSFSDKYAEKGALLSLDVDPVDAGRQCGEMANRILAGGSVGSVPAEDAANGTMTINLLIARKLGIEVNDSVIRRARTIR